MPEEGIARIVLLSLEEELQLYKEPFLSLGTRQFLPCFDQFAWLDCWNHVTGRGRRVASYCSASSPPENIVLDIISPKSSDISRFYSISCILRYIYRIFIVFLITYLARTSQERKGHTVLRFTVAYNPICYVYVNKKHNKLVHIEYSEPQLRD
jgi:hypothetical protein